MTPSRNRGSVILPCLLFLSLISVVSLGLLDVTQSETRIAESWDKEYTALLAAQSAREIALLKLKTNGDYAGETLTFPDGTSTAQVTVTTPYFLGRSVACTGNSGTAKYDFLVEAKLHPRHLWYALAVCGDLDLKQNSKVLGDLLVNYEMRAEATTKVAGNVELVGPRTLLFDMSEEIVSIDGNIPPEVEGEVTEENDTLLPLGWDLAALKALAEAAGQVFNGATKLTNQTFYGVVYLNNSVKKVEFENVIVHGVIVVEPTIGSPQVFAAAGDTECEMVVKGGFSLKVIPDPTIEEDLAIIAPASTLKVESLAVLEALGCVLVGYGDFNTGSKGVVTGTTMVNGGVMCDGDIVFQAPTVTRDTAPTAIIFTQYDIEEVEYTEP
jgi:hypothetical protein